MPSVVAVLLLLGIQAFSGSHAWSGNCPYNVKGHREPRETDYKYRHNERMSDDPPVEFTLQTLGRTVRIGTLYDARTNMFFPEATLWNISTVEENAITADASYSHQKVEAAQSLKQKLEFMDIHAELQLELMDGMIKVSGSADYLQNNVEACSEVNVAFQYNHMDYEKHIDVHTNPTYGDECNNMQYTHVVTKVYYGLNAFFVFKMNTQIDEAVQHIQGELEEIIVQMGTFIVSGGGSADLTDDQQAMLKETYIRVYGDFSPEIPLPTSYDEAIDFIKNIGVNFAADDQNSPIEAVLTPLHKSPLCGDQQQIVNQIDDSNRQDLTDMLADLEVLDMEVGTMINSDAATRFMPLRENLQYFRSLLRVYTFKKKKEVQELLPKIKEGSVADDITEVMKEYEDSAFNPINCMNFLACRNREVNALQKLSSPTYFTVRNNIEMADYENANDVEYIFEKDKLVVLDLKILTDKSIIDNYVNTQTIIEDDYWYMDDMKVRLIGKEVRKINDFAMRNVDMDDRGYLLKISGYNETTAITTALVKGVEVHSDFKPPYKIEKPSIQSYSFNSFSFQVTKMEFTIGCLVSIHGLYGLVGYDIDKEYLFPSDTRDDTEVTVTIDGMEAAHIYNITYDYITLVGNTVRSESSEVFNLPGTSPPQGVTANATESSLQITWHEPEYIADSNYNKDKIKYIVTVSDGEETFTQETNGTNVVVEGLKDAIEYNVGVVAKLNLVLGIFNEVSESNPSNVTIRTSPKSPTINDDYQVDLHSATLSWTVPDNLGAPFSHYLLTWSGAGGDGERHLTATEPSAVVTDLAMNNSYSFWVKVVTEEGESAFSEYLSLTTNYSKTAIGDLHDEVYGMINKATKDLRREVHFCAANPDTNAQGPLTYNSFYTEINTVESFENSEWMTLKDGVFHANLGGVFRVRVSMNMAWENQKEHIITVVINSEDTEIIRSPMHDQYDSEYASWESLFSLEAGGTLSISHTSTSTSTSIKDVSFCVSSENFAP